MEGVLFILGMFGTPVALYLISKYFKALEKGLVQPRAGRGALPPADRRQLDQLLRDKMELEARVQNLESIVCSVDLELNARLNRLAIGQSQLRLGAGAGPAPAASTATPGAPPPVAAGGTLAAGALAAAPAATTEHGHASATGPSATVPAEAVLALVAAGQTLAGRYRIERELGRGGMGVVYLARDEQLGEAVALKVISSALAGDLVAAVDRLRREAAAARKITHPNVIRLHDVGEDRGVVFLSMEYFEASNLGQLLARRRSLPLDEARQVLGQAAEGLAAAHRAGVVHRDFKPQNVLVAADWKVKLIDFGLAKTSFFDGMTATGMIMGTPEYMAPEQVRGRAVDPRTDVYAFGCVAFTTLAGSPPFRGDTPIATAFAQCNQPPPALRQLRPDLPAQLEAAVTRALAKEPAERFQSMDELLEALRGKAPAR